MTDPDLEAFEGSSATRYTVRNFVVSSFFTPRDFKPQGVKVRGLACFPFRVFCYLSGGSAPRAVLLSTFPGFDLMLAEGRSARPCPP